MKYKAILFDLDNTLLNYSVSELKSMQHTVEEHGLMHSQAFSWETFWHIFSKINLHYWNQRTHLNYDIYQVLEFSFRDTLNELSLDCYESKTLAHLYWRTFCQACDFEEYAKDTLSSLHGKYKLAIISNGIGEAQRSRLNAGGIDHYFDTLLVSDEVGYWKPDKEIFNEALSRLNIHHTEALFVGDSLQDDYFGALNAGIDFCYYNRSGTPTANHVCPTYTIENLNEIYHKVGV